MSLMIAGTSYATAAIAGGAALGGALISADAASSAADAQAAAAGQATAASERQYQQTREDQLRQYEQVRADQAPYRQVGYSALDQLRLGMGLPATGATPSLSSIARGPSRLTADQIRAELLPQYTRAAGQAAAPTGFSRFGADEEAPAAISAPTVDDAGLNAAIQQRLAAQDQQAQQAEQQTAQQIAQQNVRDAASPDYGALSKRFTLQDYQADPGYQFRLQQGEQGISRAASARGGQYSGATLKALANFNSGLASQEYGSAYSRFNADQTNKFNRNATLAGIGQTANSATGNAGTSAYGTIAQVGQNTANQVGANLQNAGEARASGYVGQANAIGSGIKQAYNAYQQNQALQGGQFLNSNQGILDQGVTPADLYGSF